MSAGLVVFAHGSRTRGANQGVRAVAEAAARSAGIEHATAAFLHPHHPSLGEAVAQLAELGVSRVVVVPFFVMSGMHLTEDLPRIAAELARQHPGMEIRVAGPLESHPGLPAMVGELARKAL